MFQTYFVFSYLKEEGFAKASALAGQVTYIHGKYGAALIRILTRRKKEESLRFKKKTCNELALGYLCLFFVYLFFFFLLEWCQ